MQATNNQYTFKDKETLKENITVIGVACNGSMAPGHALAWGLVRDAQSVIDSIIEKIAGKTFNQEELLNVIDGSAPRYTQNSTEAFVRRITGFNSKEQFVRAVWEEVLLKKALYCMAGYGLALELKEIKKTKT